VWKSISQGLRPSPWSGIGTLVTALEGRHVTTPPSPERTEEVLVPTSVGDHYSGNDQIILATAMRIIHLLFTNSTQSDNSSFPFPSRSA